jgi:hypothetical protein
MNIRHPQEDRDYIPIADHGLSVIIRHSRTWISGLISELLVNQNWELEDCCTRMYHYNDHFG